MMAGCRNFRFFTVAIATLLIATHAQVSIALADSSASASAEALCTVMPRVQITRQQNLTFGISAPGDTARTISPHDSARAAGFRVRGEPGHAYSVTLPPEGKIFLTKGDTPTLDEAIAVSKFTTNSSNPTFDKDGSHTLYVGATREALRPSQSPGEYLGTFTVTVTYQ